MPNDIGRWLARPCAGLLAIATAWAGAATDIVVATVNNAHMIEMQRQTVHFERANPDIKVRWVTLEESMLRQRVARDVAEERPSFDVVTLGMYETQVWSRAGWLLPLNPPGNYDLGDLLPAIRDGLSLEGRLYAGPFYGEGSMLMVRKDLFAKAGLTLPAQPTWAQVRQFAARLHDPKAGVYGICLRGKPGWGDNMALIQSMVNTWGGQIFDLQWQPQINSKPWREAVTFYVDLLRRYGPPSPTSNNYNELLALFRMGKCAQWVDATIAASFVTDPAQSRVAESVAFAPAPTAVTPKGASWLWAWALAVPKSANQPEAARRFVLWATSRAYVEQVAQERGWRAVPTGSRRSTYERAEFQQSAPFAGAERRAIESVNPSDPTLPRSPYAGVQYAAIPEFQAIGIATGLQISQALQGRITVDQALELAQQAAEREMAKRRQRP